MYVVINNNKIDNFIEIQPEVIPEFEANTGMKVINVPDDLPLEIGDDYDGTNFYRGGVLIQ